MSVSLAMVNGLERLGDRFNPIVVKEVRQALKSRQFVLTFLLLLLAAWAGSIFGVSYLGQSIDYGSSALMFYAGFLFALCAATLVIVPQLAAGILPGRAWASAPKITSTIRWLVSVFPATTAAG